MAFKIVDSGKNFSQPVEVLLGTNSEAYVEGEALSITSGRLTKCAATTTPEGIALKTQAAEATAITPLPFLRVMEDHKYSVKSTATVAATLVGNKVTLHTDGLLTTATTASGVATIISTDGATTTSNLVVSFRR